MTEATEATEHAPRRHYKENGKETHNFSSQEKILKDISQNRIILESVFPNTEYVRAVADF